MSALFADVVMNYVKAQWVMWSNRKLWPAPAILLLTWTPETSLTVQNDHIAYILGAIAYKFIIAYVVYPRKKNPTIILYIFDTVDQFDISSHLSYCVVFFL